MVLLMSSSFQALNLYRKQRLSFMPWFIIPIILFYLGHGPIMNNGFAYSIFSVVFVGIIFFRIFDDMFCYRYDKFLGKRHDYLINSRGPVIFFGALLGGLFLSLLVFFAGINTGLFGLFFVLINLIFYKFLLMNRLVVFVSLLKYPFLLIIIGNVTLETNFFWVVMGTMYFVGREVLEEIYNIRSKKIEVILMLLLLTIKYSIQG